LKLKLKLLLDSPHLLIYSRLSILWVRAVILFYCYKIFLIKASLLSLLECIWLIRLSFYFSKVFNLWTYYFVRFYPFLNYFSYFLHC